MPKHKNLNLGNFPKKQLLQKTGFFLWYIHLYQRFSKISQTKWDIVEIVVYHKTCVQLCKLFRLVLANILNSSLLNCLPYVLKTCSRTSGPCLLTCSRANVPCVLTCSRDNVHCMFQRLRANMSCVLTCSTVNVSFILTCSGANVPCVLAFQRALHTHVLMCLTCPRAQVPTYLQ